MNEAVHGSLTHCKNREAVHGSLTHCKNQFVSEDQEHVSEQSSMRICKYFKFN